MFRLARQVRFAINDATSGDAQLKPSNSFGGFPSLTGLGRHYALDITLTGPLEAKSSYLRNIKDIDDVVRERAIPLVEQAVRTPGNTGFDLPVRLLNQLAGAWPGAVLIDVTLHLSPTLHVAANASEKSMIRLSQKFEFSASHRLHNPELSDAQNRQCFGKCNNPHGHGHNYEMQVTLVGRPDTNGVLIDIPSFERIVASVVVDRFDHKNLNLETEEFKTLNPSVEHIAMVSFQLLKPPLSNDRTRLASVTVWETPKTWCEYSEG